MKTLNEIKQTAYRLLTPNDSLDVTIFDYQEKMHPEVRETLLNNAYYVITNTLRNIEGLKVQDIYLNGSVAGYFYHEFSDIDMRIEIHNDNCDYITKDEYLFNRFLYALNRGSLPGYQFKFHKRLLDIKLSCSQFEIVGLYSILNNKWMVKPTKNFAAGITVDEIMDEFYERYKKIRTSLDQYSTKPKLNEQEQEELGRLYNNLIRNNNISARDYIVYKLLNYAGVFHEMKNILSQGVKAYLSVK